MVLTTRCQILAISSAPNSKISLRDHAFMDPAPVQWAYWCAQITTKTSSERWVVAQRGKTETSQHFPQGQDAVVAFSHVLLQGRLDKHRLSSAQNLFPQKENKEMPSLIDRSHDRLQQWSLELHDWRQGQARSLNIASGSSGSISKTLQITDETWTSSSLTQVTYLKLNSVNSCQCRWFYLHVDL